MGTILRAIVAYWALLIVLRIVGRRALDHMTPFELIIMFMLGGLSIQAIVGDDRSMTNAILGVMAIGLMHVLVAFLKQRFPRFGKLADGTPIPIFEEGKMHKDRMKKLRVQDQDIMASARGQGLERLDQIKYAIVERNGSISIIKQKESS